MNRHSQPSPRLINTAALALSLVTAFSCSFDFSDIPEGAQISCLDNGACPGGWICNTAIGLCVKEIDPDPPKISSTPELGPRYLKKGATAVLKFEADKELLREPDVKIRAGGADRPFTIDASQSARGYYVYTYAAAGDEPEGEEFPVLVTLTDKSGNKAEDLKTGAVVFDFTPPDIRGDASAILYKREGCPLLPDDIGMVTKGSSARITFMAGEELLDSRPSGAWLQKTSPEGTVETSIELVYEGSVGPYHTYSAGIPADAELPDGEYRLRALMTDLAGNSADVTGRRIAPPGFTVATSAPEAPDVNGPGKVVLRRIPWGRDEKRDGNYSETEFSIEAGPGAADPRTVVVIAYKNQFTELGRASAGGGTFNRVSITDDNPEVYLRAYDSACNESAPVKVRDGEWIATMGLKAPGSTLANQCVFTTATVFGRTLGQAGGVSFEPSEAELAGLAKRDFNTTKRAGEGGWLELPFNGNVPNPRYGHGLAYDDARGRMVLFGGYEYEYFSPDLWEWDGEAGVWANRSPSGVAPEGRRDFAAAYDSARGKTVVFGGASQSGGIRRDMWEWDGESLSWSPVTPSGTWPDARTGHAMAYDGRRGKMVMFGGFNDEILNETWEWDGRTRTWTDRTQAWGGPGARYNHAMTYDSGRSTVVLHGGRNENGTFSDTWEWDGYMGRWTNVTPSGSRPQGRYLHAMAYDAGGGKVVMFGGCDPSMPACLFTFNDTWEWNGDAGTWSKRSPAGAVPEYREGHAMAYDRVRGRTVLFGGLGESLARNDLWEWNTLKGSWARREVGVKPEARQWHAMAYDEGRRTVLMFGGDGEKKYLQDSWEWDGEARKWTDRTPATAKPAARYEYAMAYDSVAGAVTVFGGYGTKTYQDTWQWNGASGSWSDRTPAAGSPEPRAGAAMAFDSDGSGIFLFGGSKTADENYDDTWEWNGADGLWKIRDAIAARPGARSNHSFVYDKAGHRSVLFGGDGENGLLNDIWEWNGAAGTWTGREPSGAKPAGRASFASSYDPSREKVAVFGGVVQSGSRAQDLWEWDGVTGTWADRTPSGQKPNPRIGPAMSYSGIGGRMVMFGGGYSGTSTWEWDGGAGGTPAGVLSVPFSSARAGGAVVEAVTATVYAGGVGYPARKASEGCRLLVWDEGGWREVSSGGFGVSNPGKLEWTSADALELNRIFFGDRLKLNLAVVPSEPNGTAEHMGVLAVDYVEVAVRYRLP